MTENINFDTITSEKKIVDLYHTLKQQNMPEDELNTIIYGAFRAYNKNMCHKDNAFLEYDFKTIDLKTIENLIEQKNNVNVAKEYDFSLLMWAAARRESSMIYTLLRAGADINAQDIWGKTAIMIGAAKGYSDIVKVLIARKADLTITDKSGHTAMDYAKQSGKKACISSIEFGLNAKLWEDKKSAPVVATKVNVYQLENANIKNIVLKKEGKLR